MSEELFVSHSAPTLAGIKTANLFNVQYVEYEKVINQIQELNTLLVPKGIHIIPLREKNHQVLIYVYRPSKLKADFQNIQVQEILKNLSYPILNLDECIMQLATKLRENKEFPHEIGLFLGYPPEDVKGFIENNAQNYKAVGTWKVYGDESAAKEKFNCYKKCTLDYCIRIKNGLSLEQLVVAS